MTEPARPSSIKKDTKPPARDSATPLRAASGTESTYSPVEIEAPRSPLLFAAVLFGLPLVVIILIEALHLFGH